MALALGLVRSHPVHQLQPAVKVLYQRGAALLKFCRSRLQAVEEQVKLLEDGQLKSWDAE